MPWIEREINTANTSRYTCPEIHLKVIQKCSQEKGDEENLVFTAVILDILMSSFDKTIFTRVHTLTQTQ